ncbi:hypothetical protein FACS1894141_1330 [Spirochaetia bacterium]|nr:hypothetical protein FACS1894141_1330 [Spirochaetia bacterium]
MILSYFDSSVLLAILLDEDRKSEAYNYWSNSLLRISSILLRIETIITLRRTFEHNKKNRADDWLQEKIKIADEFLNEVHYRIISEKLEREIYLKKELAKCRTLDAIHIATALQFREINNEDPFYFYTFDQTMHDLAEHFRFKTNRL